MGWAFCGQDSEGRDIGYGVPATCDHPECSEAIDRGLAYACGGMHGDLGDEGCEGYFCDEHLIYAAGLRYPICAACLKLRPGTSEERA
jgi:hypothetical protein